MAALAGSLLGFLRFNFNPATIFMGDGGSLFIGYVLAVSAIRTNQKSSAAVSLLVPIVALALPIADTLLAMVRRGLRGRPMFSGDKEHIHHRLLALGLSHREVVLLLYAVAVGLGGLSIAIASYAPQVGLTALVVLGAGVIAGLWSLGFFRMEATAEIRALRHRNLELRGAIKNIAMRLRRARSIEDVVESIQGLAPALRASAVRLDLTETLGIPRNGHAANSELPVAPLPDKLRARFPVEPGFGYIEIEWSDGRSCPERDDEIAAETLCQVLGPALERTMSGSQHGIEPAPVPVVAAIQPAGFATRIRG